MSLFTPARFSKNDRDALLRCIREFPFALAISGTKFATWIPVVASVSDDDDDDDGSIRLEFHMARANPHAQYLEKREEVEEDLMIAFLGPHGYISPKWYTDRRKSVPTWNFTAFHVWGKPPRVVSDREELGALLNRLVVLNEKLLEAREERVGNRWSMAEPSPKYIDAMTEGIIGFSMTMTRFQGKAKLSQDRSDEDKERVIDNLERSGNPRLAQEMRHERASRAKI